MTPTPIILNFLRFHDVILELIDIIELIVLILMFVKLQSERIIGVGVDFRLKMVYNSIIG